MDRNLEKIKEEWKARMSAFNNWVKDMQDEVKEIEKHYARSKKENVHNEWIDFQNESPEDDRNVLVSWWDIEAEGYHQPIRAVYSASQMRFFSLDSVPLIAIEVDIWCYFPTVPEEKL